MTVCETSITVKQFRRTPWKFQQTFLTHDRNSKSDALQVFAANIVSANQKLQRASLAIDTVVFTPQKSLGVVCTILVAGTVWRWFDLVSRRVERSGSAA